MAAAYAAGLALNIGLLHEPFHTRGGKGWTNSVFHTLKHVQYYRIPHRGAKALAGAILGQRRTQCSGYC